MKQSVTYNFKKLTAVLFASLVANFETNQQEAIKSKFEELEGGKFYKRRSETVELTLPAQLEQVVGTEAEVGLFTGAVARVVSEFVKYQYIDNFEAVGPHDLETIARVQAESGSRSVGFSIPEDTINKAVDSFKAYIAAAIGNVDVAEKLASVARARFTRSAIMRGVGQFNEDVLNKLQVRLDAWAVAISELPDGAELVEEFAPVHGLWSASINRLLKADQSVDIAAIL